MKHYLAVLAFYMLALPVCAQDAPAPELRVKDEAVQLYVDGAPFIILGGELGNSTASDLENLAPHWDRFEALGMNTVLAPVYWELIEPVEGEFDFTLVDGLIAQAEARDMKLVILWFATWKNSMSTYVPGWVKMDHERFVHVRSEDGTIQDILSPHSLETAAADARAFTAFMAHLAGNDPNHTVIMVQVENEIGMLPSPRDYSTPGQTAYQQDVPQVLLDALGLQTSGSWAEVFGDDPAAQEIFTAFSYARFVETVIQPGLAEHDIPVFVNAALNRPGAEPGQYPGGGPLAHLIEVWRAGAPSLDFLAPDIYFPDFTQRISEFAVPGNALFVPEANRAGRRESLAEALYTFGELDGIGFSPFAIEDISEDGGRDLAAVYKMMSDFSPLLFEAQGTTRLTAVKPEISYDGEIVSRSTTLQIGDYTANVSFKDPWVAEEDQYIPAHGALILELSPSEFYVIGKGATLTFETDLPDRRVGLLSVEAGHFEDGIWVTDLHLNGDQTHQGRHVRLPSGEFSAQKVSLYTIQ